MQRIITTNSLNSILFISFFVIFIPLVPIGIETEPIISFFVSVLIIIAFGKSADLLKKDIIFLSVLIIVLMIYAICQAFFKYDYQGIIEFIKYLIGPIIFLGLRISKFSISYSLLKKVIYTLTAIAAISLFTPGIYVFIFQHIIPRFASNVGSDARGIVILTPEPSYFAVFQTILLITIEKALSQSANDNEKASERKKLLFLKYLVLLLSLLTKSALVIIYAIIFLIPDFKKINFKKLILGVFILLPIAGLLIYFFFSQNRLFDVVELIYNLTKEGNFDWTAFLFTQESSGGTRVVLNFLAIAAIGMFPFGAGLGSFSSMLNVYGDHYNLDISKHEVLGSIEGRIYPQTYFANLCNDVGVFAFLLIFICFANNAIDSKNFKLKRNACLLIMLFFQSQITNPAFWFLLAVSKINPDEKIIK